MAMEPIGSIMTYGAQQNAQPVRTVETTEGPQTQPNVVQADPQTLAVAKVSENASGDEGGSESSGSFDSEAMRRAIKEINKKSGNTQSNVQSEFGIHEETNRITIRIVDKKTKEVIKELPAEKTLDMIAKVWEMAGMFVDEKR